MSSLGGSRRSLTEVRLNVCCHAAQAVGFSKQASMDFLFLPICQADVALLVEVDSDPADASHSS
jgi:hypothetical protein